MSAEILKGAPVAEALNRRTAEAAAALARAGTMPTLAIVRVGARPDDLAYERGAMKRCAALGIAVRQEALPGDADQTAMLDVIHTLNQDETVHGVLLQRPLPEQLDEAALCAALAPEKDVDGITPGSLAGVFTGSGAGFAPCTAQACMEILDYYGVDCTGRRALVIGRSLVVGRPAAMLLMQRNATVTIAHTRTKELPALARAAEIVVAAAGQRGCVTADFCAPGQILLDVGIHTGEDGKLCGDVDFPAAEGICDAVTPVPGGVGSVTTAVLAANVVSAAGRQLGRE